MPSSLTSTKIKDTYGQVLHVDGGVTSTPKLVYDGDGTATALKVSTTDVQVNNSPVLTDADLPSLATAAQGAKADTAVQPAAIANMLETSDIGVSVQAYDADLTAWSGKTAPSGTVVGTSDSQALSNKTFSDNPVFSAGTANSVPYLNGSKVLTTGSALTFDGLDLKSTGRFFSKRADAAYFGFSDTGVETGYLQFNQYVGVSLVSSNANPIKFVQNGSEQMRLTSTGLGIGTSSPGYKVDAVGSIQSQGTHGAGSFNAFIIKNTLNSAGSGKISWQGGNSNETWAIAQNQIVGTGYLEFNYLGANKAVFDPSGNLGLGVTPSAWYSSAKAIQVGATGGIFGRSTDELVGVISNAYNSASSFGTYTYMTTGNKASLYLQNQGAHQWYTAPSGTAGNAISFTQAMTLDASGNLLVGTTSAYGSPGITMSPTGVIQAEKNDLSLVLNRTSSDGGVAQFRRGGTPVGSISVTGSATSYNTSSDYRLKENIQPMQNALSVVQQLNTVTYTWKADGSDGQGFIAHELQAVVPDCVTGEKDAVDAEGNPVYQGIDTSFLVATLTKAIQEQQEQINQLKAEVAALKAIN